MLVTSYWLLDIQICNDYSVLKNQKPVTGNQQPTTIQTLFISTMEKRWNLLQADEIKASSLQQALKIHPAICKILAQRGIDSFDIAKEFFRPPLSALNDPWLMKDMDKA